MPGNERPLVPSSHRTGSWCRAPGLPDASLSQSDKRHGEVTSADTSQYHETAHWIGIPHESDPVSREA
jgi:hypothetical protein